MRLVVERVISRLWRLDYGFAFGMGRHGLEQLSG